MREGFFFGVGDEGGSSAASPAWGAEISRFWDVSVALRLGRLAASWRGGQLEGALEHWNNEKGCIVNVSQGDDVFG